MFSACATCDYSFIRTISKYLDMVSWKLLPRMPLVNGVTRWCHEWSHVTFPETSYNVRNFLVVI